jgi:hypothetical protein
MVFVFLENSKKPPLTNLEKLLFLENYEKGLFFNKFQKKIIFFGEFEKTYFSMNPKNFSFSMSSEKFLIHGFKNSSHRQIQKKLFSVSSKILLR